MTKETDLNFECAKLETQVLEFNLLPDRSLPLLLKAVGVAFDWEAGLLDQLQPLRERRVMPPEE